MIIDKNYIYHSFTCNYKVFIKTLIMTFLGWWTKEVDVIEVVVGLISAAIGIMVGYFIRKNISESKIGQAENLAKEIIDKATSPKDNKTTKA